MKPVKHPIVVATALLAAGLFSTPASHADALSEAYNAGYNTGYEAGFIAGQNSGGGGGGWASKDIILKASPNGGVLAATPDDGSVSRQPEVGFYWSGMAKVWQAYKLKENATNTITPGTGLPVSEWLLKNSANLDKYGIDSKAFPSQLEDMSKLIRKINANANIWFTPGEKTQ